MKKLAVVMLVAVLALALTGCGSSSKSSGASGSAAQKVEQAFDTDVALVKYRDKMEPSQGNVMVSFSLENKTDSTVVVGAENIVVNGEYAVEVLGGSAAPIGPGQTGSVAETFGYAVQTPLQSVDDIKSLSCDLVMHDNDSMSNVVGSVPVSVEL